MIEDLLHDMLGDVPVDEPRSECVPPLVGFEMDRPAVLVADVAGLQPCV